MKEYKRLTAKDWQKDKHTKAYERLAELEDKIENGTLIELPCKVGDTVYYETFTRNGRQSMGIQGHTVLGVRVMVMAKNNYGDMWTEIPLSCFGKDAFLTKAEAEAKLKELQEKR